MPLDQLTAALQWRHWQPRMSSDSGMSSPSKLRGLSADPAALRRASVLFLGVGAVGGVALQGAARHQVGTLIVVDPDSYGIESRLTQPCLPDDTGRPKAWTQGERAHAINPAADVWAAVGFAQELPYAVVRQAQVIAAAGDNRELMVWAAQLAAGLGKPLVQGAVDGASWTAIVRGYGLTDPEAACPACGMSRAERSDLSSRYGCDPSRVRLQGRQPTRTLPVVCATAGNLALGEALKWLLGLERHALAGAELACCLLTHRSYRTTLPRNPRCPGRHRRWGQADIAEPPSEVTLSMLAARLGLSADGLQVRSDMPWISFALCPACGARNEVRRFARLMEPVGRCRCGAELIAGPLGRRSVLPADDLRVSWGAPLEEIGLGPGSAVGFSDGEDWTYCFAAGLPLPPEAE
jgi:molybdopterin/thiamine biosynthesis adenylyltransferase